MTTRTDWPTADALEAVLREALKRRDWAGVEAALTVMTVVDPDRAQLLYDTLRIGVAIAGERDVR